MNARIAAGLVVLVMAVAAGGVGASVINYVEGADLSSTVTPTALGALDVGTNTVAGSITVNCPVIGGTATCGGTDPADLFSVTLASGLQVTGVTINVTNFNSSDTTTLFGVAYDAALFPATPLTANGSHNLYSGSAIPGPSTLELLASYGVDPHGTFPATMSYSYIYTITVARITTTSVPEPATLALLCVGLAGLGFARRNQH